ncbi:MAG: DeoR/GlpR family DNA-binding transcription regulator [Paracoccaceae bacterium]|nr:DeoR/GlpR family DNA-binding transcription regulator [Paracoccaceae bacterium]
MARAKSKKDLRHEHILAALDGNPAMRVVELSETLCVSAETIRRDLAELDRAGRINRTYGGAIRSQMFEPALAERLKLHVKERQAIATDAVAALGDANSVFIGGGATTLHFARALRSTTRRFLILTTSFSIATELSSNPLLQVMSLPGIVEGKEGMVQGPETVAAIMRYRASVAVLGASGIDASGTSEALMSAAQVYSAMVASSERTLVLADTSKFDKRALQMVTNWAPNVTLITNSSPTESILAGMTEAGASFISTGSAGPVSTASATDPQQPQLN